MAEHLHECYLSERCPRGRNDDGIHRDEVWEGLPDFCPWCRRGCICDRLRNEFHRGFRTGEELNHQRALDYGKRKYDEGYRLGRFDGYGEAIQRYKVAIYSAIDEHKKLWQKNSLVELGIGIAEAAIRRVSDEQV